MKLLSYLTISTLSLGVFASSASAALIAGADFSDSAVFDATGGNYDNAATSTDDLNLTDNITVSNWSFSNAGTVFLNDPAADANAQVGMPSDNVVKIDGNGASQPDGTTDLSTLSRVSFDLTIPSGTILNLDSVDWVHRQATNGATQVRWMAFNTSLDTGLLYNVVGAIRNSFDTASVDLSGAAYQGLTNTTITFNWYAGGTGSGDQDFDTPVINGTVIPEPTTFGLFGLAGLVALLRRRR